MRFILIERNCAEAIASDRTLQSTEFDRGKALQCLLRGSPSTLDDTSRIATVATRDGLYFFCPADFTNDAVVIDTEKSAILKLVADEDLLLVFQKIIRFSLRHWGNHRFPPSERFIAGTTKVALFPFPISPFRITVERNPDNKRISRRAGNYLLVYRAGFDEGGGPLEIADVTVFRKALDGFSEARGRVTVPRLSALQQSTEVSPISTVRLTELSEPVDGHIGLPAWRRLLTESQISFVDAELSFPHRIEGPAGTGKTLCLVLKAIKILSTAKGDGREHHALFILHSEATRRTVKSLLDANDENGFSAKKRHESPQSLELTTLHDLCGRLLGRDISESEFLDRDAMESKNVRFLYINEAVEKGMRDDYPTHKKFLSAEFISFLEDSDAWAISELAQHEISIMIKGRANEDLDEYQALPFSESGIPMKTKSDRGFMFVIFGQYQKMLREVAQFDTDDVVLSALGQLNTPIWRRRREREGFDSVFVDETHIFNLNELSVFHHFVRRDQNFPIAYSADRSQSLQDRGWNSRLSHNEIFGEPRIGANGSITAIRSIFRSSPDIVKLALSITSAGASLFANFDDPLETAESIFTAEEERKCAPPVLILLPNDQEIVQAVFGRAERLANELGEGRSSVAIIAFDDLLFRDIQRWGEAVNKPLEIMKERGDIDVVRRARQSGRFVLTLPDYVGGLEFAAVLLVGIDQGRVPPTIASANQGGMAFFSYQAHSRLYVAITRARYRVELLANAQRGSSRLLAAALANNILESEAVAL